MSVLIVSTGLGSDKTKSLLLAREAERVLHAAGTKVILLDLRELTLPLCGTPESFTHGGYECCLALTSRLEPKAGQIMVESGLRLLNQLTANPQP